jgi:hypothetical protein
MVFAAYKYAEDPKAGLLANANTGGENVARGAVLGAVYGAGLGMKVLCDFLSVSNHLSVSNQGLSVSNQGLV